MFYSTKVSIFLLFIGLSSALQGIPLGTAVTHYAYLLPDQVTGTVNSSNVGTAIFSLNSATNVLEYQIIHTVTGATSVTIQGPATVGADSNTISISFSSAASPIVGTVGITSAATAAINNGWVYILVSSSAYSTGELRGQILTSGQYAAGLLPVVGTNATSKGHALVSFNATKGLSWYVQHTITNATMAHFHGPATASESANPLLWICNILPANYAILNASCTSPFNGTANTSSLATGEEAYVSGGLNYINVHSVAWPGGELRGQVYPFRYAVSIDSVQANASGSNLGIGFLDVASDNSTANGVVLSTISAVTGLHIHGPGAVGVSASPIFFFPYTQYSTYYNMTWNSTLTDLLAQQLLYFNIHSAAYPNGELRGQILPIGVGTLPTLATSASTATNPSTAQTGSSTVQTGTAGTSATAPGTSATATSSPSGSSSLFASISFSVCFGLVALLL